MNEDHAGLIDAKVELPPATSAAATVFRGGPLTCPDDGQTRAVEHELEALAGRDRSQTAPQMLTAPGERRIVGGGEVEAHHPEQGVQEPFGLAQREMVEESQGQGGLDGEIRVPPLPAPPAAPAGRPGSDRFRGHPHRHIAAANEGLIIGRPVRNAVFRLIRGMNLRLHPCSVTPAVGPEKCGPRRPTRAGPSCNNAAPKREGEMLTASRERGVIGCREIDAQHPEDRGQEALGLTQRSVEDETERQGGFDGEIGILELPAPPADASRCPRGDRVGREPEGDVASPHEGSVVLGPVPDAIRSLVLRMHSRLHIEIMTRRRSRWSTCRPLLAHRAESAHQRRLWGPQDARSVDQTTTFTPHRHLELLPVGTAEGCLSPRTARP